MNNPDSMSVYKYVIISINGAILHSKLEIHRKGYETFFQLQ